MLRRLLVIIFCLASAVSAFAQETAEDYYIYKLERAEQPVLSLSSDTLLFLRATQQRLDIYDDVASYRFAFIRHARRGYDFSSRNVEIDGIRVRSTNISLLRRLGLTHYAYAGIDHPMMSVGDVAGCDFYSTADGVPVNGGDVALFFSGKGYLGGVRSTLHRLMRKGWSMSAHLTARGGDDLYIGGVYQNSVDVGLRLGKSYDSGASLALVVLARMGDRGLRQGSTEEAFSLVGDNLYNPTWGRHGDKKRNSRYRRDAVPFAMLSAEVPLSNATTMNVAVGGDYGWRAYSSLGWYDAMAPKPDNYRYMPSYYADDEVAESIANAWRMGDEAVTQVNWADMYAENSHSARGAVYALEERVERIAQAEAVVRFTTSLGQQFSLGYGVRTNIHSSRRYKRMADLLGAEYLLDVDYYLLDDDTYSNNLHNDLRNPNRKVGEGERFSYDYALTEQSLMAEASLLYNTSRWRVGVDAAVGGYKVFRTGYFEKELFSGAGSYGKSKVERNSPYMLKATAGYAFSAGSYLDFGVAVSAVPQSAEVLWLNPMYNNRIVDDADMAHRVAAEINYKFHRGNFDAVLSAFLHHSSGGRAMMRCYDDLSAQYCDVEVEDIATLRYGLELSARMRFSEHFSGDFTLAAGRYIYSNNPRVSHFSDTDNVVVSSHSESLMRGYKLGGAPQLTSSLGITYFNFRGWVASCGVNYAGLRYVEPSFVRRTERVLRQGSMTAERYEEFLSQSRLRDAVTVDVSVSRWFRVGESRLSLTLMVRNLLDARNIVYDGYEPSRIRHYKSGANRVYAPQDDVVTYAYPRTFYGVVSWKF